MISHMKQPPRDNIYQNRQTPSPFRFDEKVAAVFPDMIQRSVPGYEQIINGIQQLATKHVQNNTNCYDMGCSLGAASLAMSQGIKTSGCEVIAVDNSSAMIERCRLFVESYHHATPIKAILGNIAEITINNASMVVLNFTLQFIPMALRQSIIDKIYNGLNSGGLLVLSEKIKSEDDLIDQRLIDLHHDFKRANGYSELEISQKRNALENVLIPETISQHKSRLTQAGFKHSDVWHQQFNFCSILAIK